MSIAYVNYIYTNEKNSGSYMSFFSRYSYTELISILNIIYSLIALREKSRDEIYRKMLEKVSYMPYVAKAMQPENIFFVVRSAYHLSQFLMAEKLGVNIKTLRNLENGRWMPDSEILFHFYEYFNVPPSILLEDERGLRSEICILLEMIDENKRKCFLESISRCGIHKTESGRSIRRERIFRDSSD